MIEQIWLKRWFWDDKAGAKLKKIVEIFTRSKYTQRTRRHYNKCVMFNFQHPKLLKIIQNENFKLPETL